MLQSKPDRHPSDDNQPDSNNVLNVKEVQEHLRQLHIKHARMMGIPLPPPPLSTPASRAAKGKKRRPPKKVRTTLRLCPMVVDAFRATGPGWQPRINETLRKAVEAGEIVPAGTELEQE